MTKKSSVFKKSFFIYTITLVLLSFLFLLYVYGNLKKYENNLVDNFLLNTIHNLDKKELQNHLKEAKQSEHLIKTYEEMVKDKEYTFVRTSEFIYDAYLDGRVLFTIHLKSLGEKSCLGLLKYEKYEVERIIPHLENGLIYYTITLPNNYKLLVDGQEYTEKTKEENIPNLEFMYYNENMPKLVTYELKNLEHSVKLEAEDFNGEKVNLKQDGIHYQLEGYKKANTWEEARKYIGEIDIETIAKNWSLFLTKDLNGERYGFGTIKKYLLEDTEMWKKAYNWAHSIDITFTSSHTLKNPPFTNIKIENFVIYDTNAFSCEVYLEKHMIVKGKEQTDIMHDTMSFIKEKNEWKLMNIKGITDGAKYND